MTQTTFIRNTVALITITIVVVVMVVVAVAVAVAVVVMVLREYKQEKHEVRIRKK